MIPFLPPEIIQNIIENVEYNPSYSWFSKDLIRCCQVSKTFLAPARPLLYEDIWVQLLTATHYDYSDPQFEVAKREDSLIKTFEGNQELRRLVKKVTIFEMGGNTWSYRHGGYEPLYLLKPMFDLPNVETITIEDLLQFEEIEEAVTAAQNRWIADGRVSMPALRAHGYGDGEVEDLSLKAIYEGYSPGWAGHTGFDWSAILAPSHHSLRRLAIPFGASTSLSSFSQLERLSLEFLHHDPLDPIPNFLRVLRALTSLQLLILNNHISVDSLKSLLGTGALAASLPRSLTTLSLNLFPTHPDTVTFVRDLPDLTSLKYFNYEGEQGGLGLQGDIELECHRRGIKLSLNEEWEIWW
ncbi:hypothetical protein JCM5353_000915 [Sporobolomyces roseus]